MTGPDADILASRISVHLRKNEFAICTEIIEDTQRNHHEKNAEGFIEAVAELGLELRLVTLMEKKGYIYLRDLLSVDVHSLHRKIKHFGADGSHAVYLALKRAHRHNRLLRKSIKARLLGI